MTQVSESLAGRLSVIELTPLLWSELTSDRQRQRLWLFGGYPDGGVLNGKKFPIWQRDYLNLLAQRDLPNWGLTAPAQTTQRLLRMLAAVHGQEWNASQLRKSLALSYHTVNGYLDYLEGAFLIRRLPAYHANIRKRLVKRPKVYWRDSGLLHAWAEHERPRNPFAPTLGGRELGGVRHRPGAERAAMRRPRPSTPIISAPATSREIDLRSR